ncbi:PAS domain-containing sensor histidine kinase [Sphingobacterium chungjuense]|uniref:PAS domain-containing sensor histidine kinase n=1 Tax=Sphingobacterium chungjuense TaxID=2675553 RepID=UPI0014085252|nr:PAS domain-containing sensor histidine kinase [Sphingobacterium chungjuense]
MNNNRLESLQILEILNQSSHPVAVYTGEEILIEFANPAMLAAWGKPRDVIGKTLSEALPEIANQPFVSMLRRVWNTGIDDIGEAIAADLVTAGQLQRYYFDYEYKAIKNEAGEIYAIMQTALDVTEKVKSKEEAHYQASLFRELVQQAPVAITVLHGEQLIIDIVNPKMLEIWGKDSQIIGKPLSDAMPELEGQPFIGILVNVFLTGKPYYGQESWAQIERGGKIVEGYFNFDCQPFWSGDGRITGVLQVVTEVTDQVMARLEIQQTKTMMDMAINAANLGTWQIEPHSKKLIYNEALLRIFGYKNSEPITFEMIMAQVSDDYREIVLEEIELARSKKSPFDLTYSQRRFDDNGLIWLRAFGKIAETSDYTEAFSGFVMDITEDIKDEQRKNDFIGMVSHELKTPLTSVNSYVQLLSRHGEEHHNTFVKKIAGSTVVQLSKMTAMINGFLNLSRFESGKITLDQSIFNMGELVQEIIEEHQVTMSTRQINFSQPFKFDVSADRIKIGIVISNLLNNAIKYSPNDSEINISCKEVDGQIEFCVIDQGIGISKDNIGKIFERFYRVRSEFVSGFGIGLYISAEIIERHNGKIWANSELGKGSTFCFSIPTQVQVEKQAPSRQLIQHNHR